MAYQPIENYGVVGNMHTAALVGLDGSVDWYCVPHFDSPSVFAALLDDHKGGRFSISPTASDVKYKQLYWPDTNILITRALCASGVGEIETFMPVGPVSRPLDRHQLIRRVRVSRGELTFRVLCQPAFDYARAAHETHLTDTGAVFESAQLRLGLACDVPLQRVKHGVSAEITLRAGESRTFILRQLGADEGCGGAIDAGTSQAWFEQTVRFWRAWLARCTYQGRFRETVQRSALALKLLTFEPTGAIVAAVTTSLPELPGGTRNWDYRYTWLRDAAFSVYGLLRIGLTQEATEFVQFLEARCREAHEAHEPLQVVYGIDGRRELTEVTLDHLDGYRGSRPVRIGNGAHSQLQLDVYGELLDSIYLFNKHASQISYDFWTHVRTLVEYVAQNWQQPDEGIWEVRGPRQQFVSSKVMCWVALDRGLRLADKRSFPAPRAQWIALRDQIYETIMDRGFNQARGAFVQVLDDGAQLDASSLLMPLVFFAAPNDPRMLSTLDAILSQPTAGGLTSDGLVHRYATETGVDGFREREGTFNMCTFWLVEALTRAGNVDPGKLEQARLLFERMLGYANHVGLYAEETGNGGEALGNFPQAFTHLSLISAAFNLDRTLGKLHGR
ncbi:MAG: glycoside hydrolase family 15 protein [Polyangiales bacterium]